MNIEQILYTSWQIKLHTH